MRSVPSAPLVGPFADRLLAHDFPALAPARRQQAVAFTIRRVDALPSVMRFGVTVIAAVVRGALALPIRTAVVGFLSRTALPVIGEYVRLVRSLGYAYVFETWPDTRPDGSSPESSGPESSGPESSGPESSGPESSGPGATAIMA